MNATFFAVMQQNLCCHFFCRIAGLWDLAAGG